MASMTRMVGKRLLAPRQLDEKVGLLPEGSRDAE